MKAVDLAPKTERPLPVPFSLEPPLDGWPIPLSLPPLPQIPLPHHLPIDGQPLVTPCFKIHLLKSYLPLPKGIPLPLPPQTPFSLPLPVDEQPLVASSL